MGKKKEKKRFLKIWRKVKKKLKKKGFRTENRKTPSTCSYLEAREPAETRDQSTGKSSDTDACSDWQEEISEIFRNWLHDLTDSEYEEIAPPHLETLPDLFSFYGELVALKQEVKLQNKSFSKTGSDIIREIQVVHEELIQQKNLLKQTTSRERTDNFRPREDARKTVLLELLKLRDAIVTSTDFISEQLADNDLAMDGRIQTVLNDVKNSGRMLLDKADDVLRRLNIMEVAHVGDDFDSTSMRAVAKSDAGNRHSGTVTRIFRQGYRRDDRLIQTADVEIKE